MLERDLKKNPANQSSQSMYDNRTQICNTCDQRKELFGFSLCGTCKCLLGLKTRLRFSSCPLGKW